MGTECHKNEYACITDWREESNMSDTEILAFSDINSSIDWPIYRPIDVYEHVTKIFDHHKPDILMLAGDLIPTRVERFYEILEHASQTSEIYLVRGNHDAAEYDVKRISSIRNCYEISGKLVTSHDIRILGLGYDETHYSRTLRPLVEKTKTKADIVLTHAEQRRLQLICQIQPSLIVRGHFGLGRCEVDGIPIVSPIYPYCYAIIETRNGEIEEPASWFLCPKTERRESCDYVCAYGEKAIQRWKAKWPWLRRMMRDCPLGYAQGSLSHIVTYLGG